MAEIIRMPKMSDTMEEGVIAGWLKKVGDEVKSGDILAEVETDKATMELESYDDGFLLHVGVKDGESVPVDGVIAIIGEKGENIDDILKEVSNEQNNNEAVDPKDEEEIVDEDESVEENLEVKEEEEVKNTEDKIEDINIDFSNESDRIKASPLAKKLAAEKGIDISMVKGSGDGGRIIKEDIENFKHSKNTQTKEVKLPEIYSEESYEEIPISQMRKTISKRLAESKFSAPHFYLTMEIDMDNCIEGRNKINETSDVKISFNDIIIKAAAVSLRKHPMVNASFLTDKIRFNNHIHIGVAVAVDEGLLVPVIRFADNKSLAGKAKNKDLQPSDWEGNTFTISNLGMFGIDEFTAIINPNDACILAVGGIKNTPVVKNGEIVPGNVMKVTLSCDHRIVDGAIGSAFLKTLKELIEDPIKILV